MTAQTPTRPADESRDVLAVAEDHWWTLYDPGDPEPPEASFEEWCAAQDVAAITEVRSDDRYEPLP